MNTDATIPETIEEGYEEANRQLEEARRKERDAHQKWASKLSEWCRLGGEARKAVTNELRVLDVYWEDTKHEVERAITNYREIKSETKTKQGDQA